MNEKQQIWLSQLIKHIDRPVRFVIRISMDTVISINGRLCDWGDETTFAVREVDKQNGNTIRYARVDVKDINDYSDDYEHENGPLICVDKS